MLFINWRFVATLNVISLFVPSLQQHLLTSCPLSHMLLILTIHSLRKMVFFLKQSTQNGITTGSLGWEVSLSQDTVVFHSHGGWEITKRVSKTPALIVLDKNYRISIPQEFIKVISPLFMHTNLAFESLSFSIWKRISI